MNDKLKNMFDDIQGSLNKNENNSVSYKDIMKLEKDKTYLVRLVPNLDAPKKTFFAYKYIGFKSFLTGQFIQWISPATFGDPCPIQQESYKIGRTGTDAEKKRGQALWTKNSWLVNVYVIEDPTSPENNGQVKVLRLGKQIKKIIDNALTGDDKDEYGMRIFDLGKDGCNLRIKVEENDGGYPAYTMSRFTFPGEILGVGEDQKEIKKIYESIHDLEAIFPVKTYNELKEELQKHYYEKVDGSEDSTSMKNDTSKGDSSLDDSNSDDDLPFDFTTEKPSKSDVSDDDIDDLLAGLDD